MAMPLMEKKEFRWTAPEFEYFHKGASWSLVIVCAAASLVILALWQRNFLFAVFIVISAFLVLNLGHKKPNYLDFHLNDRGLTIDEKTQYPYQDLLGFATQHIASDGELAELILKRKKHFSTYLKILLPAQHLDEIRVFLNKYLPEIEYEDSVADHLSKIIKF